MLTFYFLLGSKNLTQWYFLCYHVLSWEAFLIGWPLSILIITTNSTDGAFAAKCCRTGAPLLGGEIYWKGLAVDCFQLSFSFKFNQMKFDLLTRVSVPSAHATFIKLNPLAIENWYF